MHKSDVRVIRSFVLLAAFCLGALGASPGEASSQKRQCIRDTCKPAKTLCISTWRHQLNAAKAACMESSGKARKECRKSAKNIFKQNRRSCKAALNDCRACCRKVRVACDSVFGPVGSPGGSSSELPRLISAISTDNKRVKVAFSKPMDDDATDPENYSIVQENQGTNDSRLIVTGAQFLDNAQTVVELVTMSQSDVLYRVAVGSMRDWLGNPMAPKEAVAGIVVDPSSALFQGTPAGPDDALDSDGDTLSDSAEQRGWQVVVLLSSGQQTSRHVTSDPQSADTDGDGVGDADEKAFAADPRSADTDGDLLTDHQELNDIYSDPVQQDSDGDAFPDGLEFNFFKTSPIVSDTDGDQLRDDEELLDRDRDPLIADLPRPQIIVGEVRMSLEVTSSYTDETGSTKSREETLQTTLGESRERRFGTSDTVSTEKIIEYGQTVGVEVSYGADGFGAKGSFEASFGQTFANGFTATRSSESAETSSKEYQNSVSRAFTESQNRSVTRTVQGAQIVADVSIQNPSDIAFTITNIELSMLRQDRRGTNRFAPIAALRLQGANDPTNQPAFNLGPFDPERGPFIFESTGVFPNLVEELLREPQGLVYRVVNFDLLDELGRNFVFTSQDVNDRTVGMTIDYGGGEVETYRVATHNTFDATGQMLPITVQRAFEIVGLARSTDPSGDTPNADPDDPDTLSTYGTQRDANDGVEMLTRIRDVQTDFASPSPDKRFWAVVSANREVPDTVDFSSIEVRGRDNFLFVFTRDFDQDRLLEREEIFYGSSDEFVDTDGDSISDFDEVRTGWSVALKGTGVVKVFPSPASTDTDSDGLTDDLEMEIGTDPTRHDTDFDGLSDIIEVFGPIEILLFDGDADETNNPLLSVPRYLGPPAVVNAFDGICSTTAAGDDVQEVPFGDGAADGEVVVSAGDNGLIDTLPGGDDYVRVAHDQEYMTDPLNRDTDFDGMTDGREVFVGINPNRVDSGRVLDSDNDGLSDDEEDTGWLVIVNGGTPTVVTSNKLRPDTDRDGIPDVYERAIVTDPRSRDTDGDLLFDYREFDPDDATGIYDGLALADATDRCADASACSYNPPDAQLLIGTDPRQSDSDGDGRGDNTELNQGWTVQTFGGQPSIVYSDPRFADEDMDDLDDGEEFTNRTDPADADTDNDGRLDGAELDAGLDPLRQDYNLTVTLTTVYVVGDCDASTCEGLELGGDFLLRKPDSTEVTLKHMGCSTEECACEVRDCCDAQRCEGESFVFDQSESFVLQEGEKFTLFTSNLYDNDVFDCSGTGFSSIGSFSLDFDFLLALQSSYSHDVGSSGCLVRINYTFTKGD